MTIKIRKKKSVWCAMNYYVIVFSFLYILVPILTIGSLGNVLLYISILLLVACIVFHPKRYNVDTIFSFMSIFLVILILHYGKWVTITQKRTLLNTVISLGTFWMFYVLSDSTYRLPYEDRKKMLNLYLILIGITSVTTILGCFRFPLASRDLAGGVSAEQTLLYTGLNIGGYDFIYGVVIATPYLMYLMYKSRGIKKMFIIAVIVVSVIAVIISQYTTALVLISTSIFLMIIYFSAYTRRRKVILYFILAAGVFFCVSGGLTLILPYVVDFLWKSDKSIAARAFEQIIGYLSGGGWYGNSQIRAELRRQSMQVFLHNPLYGCVFHPQKLGGHSEIIDLMGSGGVIGLGLFVYLILRFYKKMSLKIKDVNLKFTFLVDLGAFIFLAYINTAFIAPDIAISCFFLPTLLFDVTEKIPAHVIQ